MGETTTTTSATGTTTATTTTNIKDLPNELLFNIYTHLPLKSLIASRGVNRKWKHLISSAHLHPARRKLLNLYLDILSSPHFIASRSTFLPHLKRFNRQGYIHQLETKVANSNTDADRGVGGISGISEEFRVWIMEWPERATFVWMWPGLYPCPYCGTEEVKYENLLAIPRFPKHSTRRVSFDGECKDNAFGRSAVVKDSKGEEEEEGDWALVLGVMAKTERVGGICIYYLVIDGRGKCGDAVGKVFDHGYKEGIEWVDFLRREWERTLI